jgi:hypothetical protein
VAFLTPEQKAERNRLRDEHKRTEALEDLRFLVAESGVPWSEIQEWIDSGWSTAQILEELDAARSLQMEKDARAYRRQRQERSRRGRAASLLATAEREDRTARDHAPIVAAAMRLTRAGMQKREIIGILKLQFPGKKRDTLYRILRRLQ